jgi:hypothetical protein
MALSDSALSTLLQTQLTGKLDIQDSAKLKDVCDAIAKAVVDHIKAAAVTTTIIGSGSSAGTWTGTVA